MPGITINTHFYPHYGPSTALWAPSFFPHSLTPWAIFGPSSSGTGISSYRT